MATQRTDHPPTVVSTSGIHQTEPQPTWTSHTPAAAARGGWRPGHDASGGLASRLIVTLGLTNVSLGYGMTSAIGAIAVIVVAAVGKNKTRMRLPYWVLVYTLWCVLSITWTVGFSATAAEAIRVVIFSSAGLLLARRYCWHFVAHCAAQAVSLIAISSLILLIVDPASALMGPDLRGPLSHKNTLGFLTAAGLVCSVFLAWSGWRRRYYLALAGLNVWVLLLSNSMTSTVGAAFGILIGVSITTIKRFTGPRRILSISAIFASFIAAFLWVQWNLAEVTRLVGRNPTFTGRVPIWRAIVDAIGERPATGFGMGAPWTLDSPLRARFDSEVGFDFAGAHNGFLDAALQLGLIGLFLFLMVLLSALIRVAQPGLSPSSVPWGAGFLAFCIFHCFSEPLIMTYLGWIVIVFLTASRACEKGSAVNDIVRVPTDLHSNGPALLTTKRARNG